MGAEARRLGGMHREQKRLILARLWDGARGLFRDGLMPDGRGVKEWSIHNQTLAIMCGLQRPLWGEMVARRLLPYLRGRKVAGARPSSYWVTYVYGVMTDLGYGREVVRHIRQMYGPMVPYGGTWETFEFSPGAGSVSHAWAAHPIYHLAGTVGGVRQADVAWRRILFAPVLDLPEVDHGAVTVPTPHGAVRARWHRRQDGFVEAALRLPKGVVADVLLPGVKLKGQTGRLAWTAHAARARTVDQ